MALMAGWLLAAWLLASPAHGSGGLVLGPDQARQGLAPYLEVLDDPERRLGIDQVSSPEMAARFQPLGDRTLMINPHSKATWVRFTVEAPPAGQRADREGASNWLLVCGNHYLPEISLYAPDPAGGFRAKHSGVYRPYQDRDPANRLFVFRLDRDLAAPTTFYVRFHATVELPLNLAIWRADAFEAHTVADNRLFDLCYGALMAMILYNLVIAAMLRERVYLYYVIYLVALLSTLMFLNGQITALVDFGPPYYVQSLWLSVGLFTAFAFVFMRSFLNTKTLSPLMDRILLGAAAYGLVIAAVGLLNQPGLGRHLTLASGLVSPWLALAAGITSLRKGFKPAAYFLVAWGAMAVAVLAHALWEVGPLAGNHLARNALVIGSSLEAVLLSLALADRIRRLRREKESLAASKERFRSLSLTDGLTELFNRRHFEDMLAHLGGEYRRSDDTTSLLMLDIDDFKSYNDKFGHEAGDEVLVSLARTIRDNVRSRDIPCRWGGEEFAVILPDTSLDEAGVVAERIRKAFAATVFSPEPGPRAWRTVSVGLASARPGEKVAGLVQRADQALYEAKRAGKNRLVKAP